VNLTFDIDGDGVWPGAVLAPVDDGAVSAVHGGALDPRLAAPVRPVYSPGQEIGYIVII